MSPSPSHHYCDWHWLSSSKSMIRLLPLSSLMIGMPGYWLIAMFANNLVGWTELNQHQTTRRQHSLFEFHICNNWGSGGPCLQVVVNRKRLVMLVCTAHCVPHDDLARSNALQIKTSEMLVAPRISEYFLKFWKFKNLKILKIWKILEHLKN